MVAFVSTKIFGAPVRTEATHHSFTTTSPPNPLQEAITAHRDVPNPTPISPSTNPLHTSCRLQYPDTSDRNLAMSISLHHLPPCTKPKPTTDSMAERLPHKKPHSVQMSRNPTPGAPYLDLDRSLFESPSTKLHTIVGVADQQLVHVLDQVSCPSRLAC